jgi:hypothetical protein
MESFAQNTTILGVDLVNQQCSHLCWAACGEMLSSYFYDNPMSQGKQIDSVNSLFPRRVKTHYSDKIVCEDSMCNFDWTIQYPFFSIEPKGVTWNNRSYDSNRFNFINNKIITDIDSGIPLIAQHKNGTLTHVSIIVGCELNPDLGISYLYLNDPLSQIVKKVALKYFYEFDKGNYLMELYYNLKPTTQTNRAIKRTYSLPDSISSGNLIEVQKQGLINIVEAIFKDSIVDNYEPLIAEEINNYEVKNQKLITFFIDSASSETSYISSFEFEESKIETFYAFEKETGNIVGRMMVENNDGLYELILTDMDRLSTQALNNISSYGKNTESIYLFTNPFSYYSILGIFQGNIFDYQLINNVTGNIEKYQVNSFQNINSIISF